MSTTDVRRGTDHDDGPVRSGHGDGRLKRAVHSPLGWALAGLAGVGLVAGVTATRPGPGPGLGAGVAVGGDWGGVGRLGRGGGGGGVAAGAPAPGPGPVPVLGAVVAVGVYWVVMRRLARRATPEIAWRGAGRQVLLGSAIGLAFVMASALLIAAFGGYSFSWAHSAVLPAVASVLAVQAGAAVTEELMFRGVALQAIEQRWGSRAAVAVTALFFGAAHLANPGATLWSGLAIAAEAGVMLGAAFLWRRSIWLVVGVH